MHSCPRALPESLFLVTLGTMTPVLELHALFPPRVNTPLLPLNLAPLITATEFSTPGQWSLPLNLVPLIPATEFSTPDPCH